MSLAIATSMRTHRCLKGRLLESWQLFIAPKLKPVTLPESMTWVSPPKPGPARRSADFPGSDSSANHLTLPGPTTTQKKRKMKKMKMKKTVTKKMTTMKMMLEKKTMNNNNCTKKTTMKKTMTTKKMKKAEAKKKTMTKNKKMTMTKRTKMTMTMK
ncbi:hypothetical protein llap_4259 [Limosa lapponica baueri]|uniref:Uncharacterized protein n=1 Tax=Limosa lapponica baueri TaxID=1758121 RepID=A0A2I0UHC4_LIMLA|nr:hypothetical protein llap_4259 [Limosa lapponica baueri]